MTGGEGKELVRASPCCQCAFGYCICTFHRFIVETRHHGERPGNARGEAEKTRKEGRKIATESSDG